MIKLALVILSFTFSNILFAQSQKITGTIAPQKNQSSQVFLPNNAKQNGTSKSSSSTGSSNSQETYGPPPVYGNEGNAPRNESNDPAKYTLPGSGLENTNKAKSEVIKGTLLPQSKQSTSNKPATNNYPSYTPPPDQLNNTNSNENNEVREKNISVSGKYYLPSEQKGNLKGQELKGALVPKAKQSYTLKPGSELEMPTDGENKSENQSSSPNNTKQNSANEEYTPEPSKSNNNNATSDEKILLRKPVYYPEAGTKTVNKVSINPKTVKVSNIPSSELPAKKPTTIAPPVNTGSKGGMLVPISTAKTPVATQYNTTKSNGNNGAVTVEVSQNNNPTNNRRNVFKTSGNSPVIIEIIPGGNGNSGNNVSSGGAKTLPVRNAVAASNNSGNGVVSVMGSGNNSKTVVAAKNVASGNIYTNKSNVNGLAGDNSTASKNTKAVNASTVNDNKGKGSGKTKSGGAANNAGINNGDLNNPALWDKNNRNKQTENIRYRFMFKSNGEFNVIFYAPLFTLTVSQYGKVLDYQVSDVTGVPVTKNYRGLVEFIGPVYLQYDYDSRLRQIANTVILYNYNGNIEKVGETVISYNYNKTVYSIGGNRIQYDGSGKPLTENINIP